MKHQSNRYRMIKGVKMENYCDLIYGDVENALVIKEAKADYEKVRKIKHSTGFYQLFVSLQKKVK